MAIDPMEAKLNDLEQSGDLADVLQQEFEQAGEPAQNNSATPAPQPPAPAPAPDTTPEAPEGKSDAPKTEGQEDPGKGEQPKSGDKFKDLLADRNAAREAAAHAETEKQSLEKRLSILEQENARLKAGSKQGDDLDGSSADNFEGKNIKALIQEGIDTALKSRDAQAQAEKSDAAEIARLAENADTPNAAEYKTEIAEVMKKHPTISAYAAYMMLRGAGTIPAEAENASNANRLNTGNRTKTNLRRDAKPGDLTPEQQEAYLRQEQSAGRLPV